MTISEKAFITKKFTQSKTSRTLRINVFEITDNKVIGKLFSNELIFLDLANSSSDPSQILILQFPYIELPCLPHHPCQIRPIPHSTKCHPSIGYTKRYVNPSQSNLESSYIDMKMPYGSNTLPIKKLSF